MCFSKTTRHLKLQFLLVPSMLRLPHCAVWRLSPEDLCAAEASCLLMSSACWLSWGPFAQSSGWGWNILQPREQSQVRHPQIRQRVCLDVKFVPLWLVEFFWNVNLKSTSPGTVKGFLFPPSSLSLPALPFQRGMHWSSAHLMVTTPPSPKPQGKVSAGSCLSSSLGCFGEYAAPAKLQSNLCLLLLSSFLLAATGARPWKHSQCPGLDCQGLQLALWFAAAQMHLLVKGAPFLMCSGLLKWAHWLGTDLRAEGTQVLLSFSAPFALHE